MNDTLRPASEQSQMTGFRRKDFIPSPKRAPYPKKGKGSYSSGNSRREREVLFIEGVQGELDGPYWGSDSTKSQYYRRTRRIEGTHLAVV